MVRMVVLEITQTAEMLVQIQAAAVGRLLTKLVLEEMAVLE